MSAGVLESLRGSSRRRVCLAGAASLALAACGRSAPDADGAASSQPLSGPAPGSLDWVVRGDWRSPGDRARDAWRHPIQSLQFWGLKPGMTVVEFWPGAGWYTDILAPYLARNKGLLIAAQFQGTASDPAALQVIETFGQKLKARPGLYGQPVITAFGPDTGPVAPAGSADMVLFLRNVHDWMAAGIADKAFHDAYAALKPGGVLGVEEHRADAGGVQDMLAADGYVQEAYVKQLAQDAGFRFDGASEINANPKDTRHYPFGVWTLPPTRQSAPRGKPADPKFDHGPYDAVGESDRMTLRFVKPK
jgi:predicted methyltransferase